MGIQSTATAFDQVKDVRIDAQTQEGKFYSLYFYIEKITYN